MDRINDALLYGSEATSYLRHEEDDFIGALAEKVVSKLAHSFFAES